MDYQHQVPLYQGDLRGFPESEELPEGVQVISLEDTYRYGVRFEPGIVYARRSGEAQHLHLLLPVDWENPEAVYPLVVYIQGSAWHRQQVFQHLPHMVRVCQQGYAVALVEYRPSEVAPFPAQVCDAKTAIRYLRMHGEEYRIDGTRVAVWGDSSGGHTAVMTGITGDREPDSDLYGGYSCGVRCVVDWYGPMDIARMNCVPSVQDHIGPDSPEGYLIGRRNVLENPDLAAATIPMGYLRPDVETPPILIMHGAKDQLVGFNQGCLLYRALREQGKPVRMYKLAGGYHGFGGFNSDAAVQLAVDFLDQHLKG